MVNLQPSGHDGPQDCYGMEPQHKAQCREVVASTPLVCPIQKGNIKDQSRMQVTLMVPKFLNGQPLRTKCTNRLARTKIAVEMELPNSVQSQAFVAKDLADEIMAENKELRRRAQTKAMELASTKQQLASHQLASNTRKRKAAMAQLKRKNASRRDKSLFHLKSTLALLKKDASEINKKFQARLNPCRHGYGQRAPFTPQAIQWALEVQRAGVVPANRIRAVSEAMTTSGLIFVDNGHEVHWEGPSERTMRRILLVNDMVNLAKEKEFFAELKPHHCIQLMVDISPIARRELVCVILAGVKCIRHPTLGVDGNHLFTSIFRKTVLPLVETPNKNGRRTIAPLISKELELVGLDAHDIATVTTDGGSENNGCERFYGFGR